MNPPVSTVRLSTSIDGVSAVADTTVWGLSAIELHDAYWKSQGVQVVVRGSKSGSAMRLERQADLYLLLERDEVVRFDLAPIRTQMQEDGIECLRVRLERTPQDQFDEAIVSDGTGRVQEIVRRYSASTRDAKRVWLTRNRRAAERWQRETNRIRASRDVRISTPSHARGTLSVEAEWFDEASEHDIEMYLQWLVGTWRTPDSSIRGIHEIGEGVWAPYNVNFDTTHFYGPIWLGFGCRGGADGGDGSGEIAFGPRAFLDVRRHETDAAVSIRPLGDVLTERRRRHLEAEQANDRHGYERVKRAIDIIGSAVILLIALPALLLLALLILIDDGRPIFFGHRRQTRGGREFLCWKFRTMCRDAERMTAQLAAMNVCDGPQFFIENDPRVTRTGRFMRRFHLDEVPQLWNVLCGEMSLVGPRPSPDKENQFCPVWREIRLSVRPGITGLWQVERTREPGRDFQEWIQYDIEYVRRASMWLDLRICVRTVLKILHRGNNK